MIICTNCNHQNSEGSVQCENCYAPLRQTSPCPNCGSFTQINAAFCGHCGYNLLSEEPLSLSDSDLDSEKLLESKSTIPLEVDNSEINNPWDTDTGGLRNVPTDPISEFEAELAPRQEFAIDHNLDQDLFEPDLEPDLDLDLEAELPEMVDMDELEVTTARSTAEVSESFSSEAIVEPAEAVEFAFDSNLEQDILESDLDSDLDIDIEAELPEMADMDELEVTTARSTVEPPSELEELEVTNPEFEIASELSAIAEPSSELEELEVTNPEFEIASELSVIAEPSSELEELEVTNPEFEIASELPAIAKPPSSIASKIAAISNSRSLSQPLKSVSESATQLQLERIILFHVQTNTDIELAQNLDIIRIGKPNSQIPPDIDVSGFPDANIVSRVHANIRVEGDNYFIEDAGSSNGTYINHKPLLIGNRHRLRFGDRISLGKGDLMTFIFKIIEE